MSAAPTVGFVDKSSRWWDRAACAADPEMWFSGRSAIEGNARHVCLRHCPVLPQCLAEADRLRPTFGVQGGILWVESGHILTGQPSRHQPLTRRCGAHCDKWPDRYEHGDGVSGS